MKMTLHLLLHYCQPAPAQVLNTTLFTLLTVSLCVAGITLGEDGVLTIERLKKDDEGLYECIARNVEGVAKTSAVITVLGKSFFFLVSSASVSLATDHIKCTNHQLHAAP